MFIPGTKVVVLTSNKQTGTGPRVGSLGFFSECLRGTLIDFGKHKGSFVATINSVIFTRFGFEKRQRLENKIVISVFPLIRTVTTSKINREVLLQNITSNLFKKIKEQKFVEQLHKALGSKPSYQIVVLAPIYNNSLNLIKVGDNEFRAWIDSVISNELISWINNAKFKGDYKGKNSSIGPHRLDQIMSMKNDRGYKLDILKIVLNKNDVNNIILRKQLILTIRTMIMVMNSKKNILNNCVTRLNQNIPFRPPFSPFILEIAKNLYDDEKFEVLCSIYLQKTKTASEVIKDIKDIKGYILGLSNSFMTDKK